MDEASTAEQQASVPLDAAAREAQAQQNLLTLIRNRPPAAPAAEASAPATSKAQVPLLPQFFPQQRPLLPHDPLPAVPVPRPQMENNVVQNLAYLQHIAQLHAARGGPLPAVQRVQLNPAMVAALDKWYLTASRSQMPQQPGAGTVAAAVALQLQPQPQSQHQQLQQPTAEPAITLNLRDWQEESDPVLDIHGFKERSNATQNKRRKLVEDFGSNGADSASDEHSEIGGFTRLSKQKATSSSSRSFATPQRSSRHATPVKPPVSVSSSSEYDPRSMTASIVAPPVELGPQLSKLYAALREQQRANYSDGIKELASQSPRAVGKRIREVMNFEFELSQDEAREIQRGKALGILDA